MLRQKYVLVEYGSDASDRRPVEDIGVLELTNDEVIEMNCRMVRTPCRVLPAKFFPEITNKTVDDK